MHASNSYSSPLCIAADGETPGPAGTRAKSRSTRTPLAAAMCRASPASPSLMSIMAVAPPNASASPSAQRGAGAANRPRDHAAGLPPASQACMAAPGPPSSPVTTTRSPTRAPLRDTTRRAQPITVVVIENTAP